MRLKQIREAKFVTQKELSEKSGVALVTISRIECDHQKPSFRTIRQLAAALGVEPGELVAGDPSATPQ